MFKDKTNGLQVKVGNGSFIDLGPYLVEVEYQYPKLWAKDSGRNLKGKQTGTLIGIFPKIICQFRKLTKSELETIRPILDASTQQVRYYDPWKQDYHTMNTYTGDWSVKNKGVVETTNTRNYKNEGFQISFIAREKRH